MGRLLYLSKMTSHALDYDLVLCTSKFCTALLEFVRIYLIVEGNSLIFCMMLDADVQFHCRFDKLLHWLLCKKVLVVELWVLKIGVSSF